MAKRMLIDASHPEETRVVVFSANRLEEFDYESISRKQLKGNIYLAKVTRVEPSLQAAFVDYGGSRHGFLPFSEIHPDYYRVPIADREVLLAAEAELKAETAEEEIVGEVEVDPEPEPQDEEPVVGAEAAEAGPGEVGADGDGGEREVEDDDAGEVEELAAETRVDTLGGDEVEDAARRRARLLRKYKIQEVIKRRQVILVQVTKEERGNKGAALTTYLSLAGRYCVLMPNTARGGGISRKISNPKDRRRLKGILEDLDIPEGVAVIVRTAGSERTKAEIRRDYEYLLRLWDEIRSTTLASTAPCLIYEEASLIKRAIRDLYQSEMDEILVDGEDGYKSAKAFMKSLMPSHARKVKLYKDPAVPLFYHYQVERQIDAMHNATVQLKSGGYIVINITEALVAIDVNSGKATRERHIEETAYKTNLEAAQEIARQLRLRDLAGLIVIDFIDMEGPSHNRAVERKLKEAMRSDRARIQLGRISPFGLLEMSRQRLRPSLFESSTVVCPHCNASGYVRTTESVALHVLRGLEEEGIRRGHGEIAVAAPRAVALHLLNQMRERLVEIERRYDFRIRVDTDESLVPPEYTLQRLAPGAPAARGEAEPQRAAAAEAEKVERKRARPRRRRKKGEAPPAAEEAALPETAQAAEPPEPLEDRVPAVAEASEGRGEETGEEKPRRRRRGKRGGRRRGGRQKDEPGVAASEAALDAEAEPEPAPGTDIEAPPAAEAEAPKEAPRRRTPRRRRAAAKAGPATAGEAPSGIRPPWAAGEVPAEAPSVGPEADARGGVVDAPDAVPPRAAGGPEEATVEFGTANFEPHGEAAVRAPAEPLGTRPPAEAESESEAPTSNSEESGPVVGKPEEPEEPDRAKRRGWWQRWG
ncbi:MAG: Rne/Rng family ribonuclease [Kiloniellaceae bacterium]